MGGHPAPNITWLYSDKPLSLQHTLLAAGRIVQIINVTEVHNGEFSCLAQNEAGSLTQKASLAIQGNFPVSVLLLCECRAMGMLSLPFSTWVSPIRSFSCHVQQKLDVLMFYCLEYGLAGQPGTLQSLRLYFTKITPNISGLLSIKHTLMLQAVLMLVKSGQFACPKNQDRSVPFWFPKIRSSFAISAKVSVSQSSLHWKSFICRSATAVRFTLGISWRW